MYFPVPLGYIPGDCPTSQQRHLSTSSLAANAVEQQKEANCTMNRFSTSSPPSFEQLLDWVEERLPADEAARVAELVAEADAETRDRVRWLRAFRRLSSETVLAPLPAATRAGLGGRFAQYAANQQAQRHQPGPLQQLIAALTFDSAAQPSLMGTRAAAGAADARQLVYATEAFDVALNIQPRQQTPQLDLLGQLLPNRDDVLPDDFAVQLLHVCEGSDAREQGLVMADDLGEFAFEALAPGRYRVVISGAALEVELPPLTLSR